MLGHVCGNATAEELHHRRSLRCTDDEEIHAHRCGKIDNCRGGVLAYGVKRNHVDAALAPELAVLAPVRDWGMTREQEIAYAQEHEIEVPVKSGAAYSVDHNLWGRSIEAGPLEDPWIAPPEGPSR